MEIEHDVHEIFKYLDKFNRIYPDDVDEPGMDLPNDDTVMCVYCNNGHGEAGFVENTTTDELGLTALIAQRWILQEDLNQLIANG